MFRSLSSITVCLLCAVAAAGQSAATPPAAQPRSHVERFSSPEARSARAETDANAKLNANPNDTEALNARALARMRLGHYAEAYEDLRRAVALKPNNAEFQANLGYALWRLGRAAEAINAEREAIRLDDKNYTGHYQLGRFLLRAGDAKLLPEAAAQLRRALEIDPRQYEVRFELIAVYRAMGDMAQAVSQLGLLQDARPSEPRVTYLAALLAADRNDINEAINGFREALRRDPTLLGAWQDLGLAYIKLNRWPEAVETFGELSQRQPDSVDAAYFLALSLFNTGKVAEAEREVRRVLRLDAGAAEAQTLLGIILASRGNAITEASEALTQAVALNPKSFDAHFYLGRVQYAMKDFAGAVKSFRSAVALNPRHAEARFFLGTVLESVGESETAMTEYQELIKLEPQSAYGQTGLGALLLKQGKTDEAINTLNHAIALDPQNFESHWALGRALILAERFTEATETLRQAVSLSPNRSDAHYQLGLALKRLGRAEEAKSEFAIVERLNTEFRTNTPKQ